MGPGLLSSILNPSLSSWESWGRLLAGKASRKTGLGTQAASGQGHGASGSACLDAQAVPQDGASVC